MTGVASLRSFPASTRRRCRLPTLIRFQGFLLSPPTASTPSDRIFVIRLARFRQRCGDGSEHGIVTNASR